MWDWPESHLQIQLMMLLIEEGDLGGTPAWSVTWTITTKGYLSRFRVIYRRCGTGLRVIYWRCGTGLRVIYWQCGTGLRVIYYRRTITLRLGAASVILILLCIPIRGHVLRLNETNVTSFTMCYLNLVLIITPQRELRMQIHAPQKPAMDFHHKLPLWRDTQYKIQITHCIDPNWVIDISLLYQFYIQRIALTSGLFESFQESAYIKNIKRPGGTVHCLIMIIPYLLVSS